MSLGTLKTMTDERMVNITKHPEFDYYVLNYSAVAQYSRTWNEVTRQCRGLIVDADPMVDGNAGVVARAFPKFHNVSEHNDDDGIDDLPVHLPFEVTGKADGSLGILYQDPDGQWAISTRGSFASDQAQWATAFYQEHYAQHCPPDNATCLFEIIYPENRIVVDYGETQALVLLAVIDNETGADLPLDRANWDGPIVERFDWSDINQIAALCAESPDEYANQEGFVIRFIPEHPATPSVRCKAKFSEYARLHKVITGVSSKTIWEMLSFHQPLDELLDRVPDEFYQWVENTVATLREEFAKIEREALAAFERRPQTDDRKMIALAWQDESRRAVLFRMLDGRKYDDLIWRSIKPVTERPFRVDVDA